MNTDLGTPPALLRARAAARPHDTAVEDGSGRLTFAELVGRADALAARLRGLGLGPDDRVGLYLEPDASVAVAVWGVLFVGAAYVPLAPEYPEDRLRFMAADAAVRAVVTSPSLAARLPALTPPNTQTILLDPRPVPTPPGSCSGGGPGAGDLAYVIYTSGSTGRPKGVMVEHGALAAQLGWLHDAHGIGPGTRVLHKTPLSFDAAQWEILASACGATVVVAAPGLYADPDGLIDAVAAAGATTLQCVPTLLRALVDTGRLGEAVSLRQVFSGGEALSLTLARDCRAALPGAVLTNLYGPTECTINASAHVVGDLPEGVGGVPIGGPADGVVYRVLDERLRHVAPGEVGELYVGGVQLARGYLGRPDLTAARFVPDPYGPAGARLYRTGDRVSLSPGGDAVFAGRADGQVKLRGYRVELDEIRLAIETHAWVRHAAAVVRPDGDLVAFVELDEREAALMDQGAGGAHHRSKDGRTQLRAQLAAPGRRTDLAGRPALALPGRTPTPAQEARVFARKTYRFFEGGPVTRADLRRLLTPADPRPLPALPAGPPGLGELAEILRWLGRFHSDDRLLPKYGYASPGALYGVQVLVETADVAGLPSGIHYYDPAEHRLVSLSAGHVAPGVRLHLVGRRRAITPVYRTNVDEVLEFEAGHLAGLLDEVLPGHGLRLGPPEPPSPGLPLELPDDLPIATYALLPTDRPSPWRPAPPLDGPAAVRVFVQAHPGRIADLPGGLYRWDGAELRSVGEEIVRVKDVIAINQRTYRRASFGVALFGPPGPFGYLELGRALHRMQADGGLGLMQAGYSSRDGHDLPAAVRLRALLPGEDGPVYFAVGGKVSAAQRAARDMKEDSVHMRGPAELIRDDLTAFLPVYMTPSRVVPLDRLPRTPNGKIDHRALHDVALPAPATGPPVPPRTDTERRIAALWRAAVRREVVSVHDDFFGAGGDSLVAVNLVNRINREFGTALPLQTLIEASTVADLARVVAAAEPAPPAASRMLRLWRGERAASGPYSSGPGARAFKGPTSSGRPRTGPVFCWPGLGGYPMSLRGLAELSGTTFYGVQAHGVNEGEEPYPTLAAMAAADVAALRTVQPEGPYTLWGYSFGARLAFETAWQLESAGERVAELMLIAPGSPRLGPADAPEPTGELAVRALLYQVFLRRSDGVGLAECLAADDFAAFVGRHHPDLDLDLVRRISAVVRRTCGFAYTPTELRERRLRAPVTVFPAAGDGDPFLSDADGLDLRTVPMSADHYGLLRPPGVAALARAIRRASSQGEDHAPRHHQALSRVAD
ncbi:amino acid adenylation domain-containing protein [Actinocorallia sp. A-T 12471]|uniref:non-ribosomal peptide synthetase family protein n=1 Tax=Actinocorallia sp. A-T 12471 TaxID=3089813 RepID=UPI0029CD4CE1|nr:amino acid adenylation domain-containing protein [Actinocorallia sp. A-T 12471]MDX6741636.1 amino acid adenylation domain-containing protein [Actinocorallia sp. A-T 12471]